MTSCRSLFGGAACHMPHANCAIIGTLYKLNSNFSFLTFDHGTITILLEFKFMIIMSRDPDPALWLVNSGHVTYNLKFKLQQNGDRAVVYIYASCDMAQEKDYSIEKPRFLQKPSQKRQVRNIEIKKMISESAGRAQKNPGNFDRHIRTCEIMWLDIRSYLHPKFYCCCWVCPIEDNVSSVQQCQALKIKLNLFGGY